MNNENPIDSTGWKVLVWSDRARRWEPFREQPWEPARVYWALVTFLRLGTNGCSVRLIGPGNIVAAERIQSKNRTNLKRRAKEIKSFLLKSKNLPKPKTKWERRANFIIERVRLELQKELIATERCNGEIVAVFVETREKTT